MQKLKKTAGYFLLLSISLVGCQTHDAAEIAKYVGRPNVESPCISNGDGTCYRAGELTSTLNMMCGEAVGYGEIQTHLEDMEKFKYLCKKYGVCN